MTEEHEQEVPQPPSAAAGAIAVNSGDPLAIVNVVLTQMAQLERRIGDKIDSNAVAAVRRWEAHDSDHKTLSEAVGELKRQFDDHMRAEREEDLIYNARLAPMKRLGLWVGKEWRTIAIALLFAFEFVQRSL